MVSCSKKRMAEKIRAFAAFGDNGNGGITRYPFSIAELSARAEFIKRMKAINAKIEFDDLGNIYATLGGSVTNAKRIAMGSHIDSVKNGGNYDGILGVISGMEILETVAEYNLPHRHPLTAMIWTNEEGALYPPAMMCSGIVCYDYLPEDIRAGYCYEKMMSAKSSADGVNTFGIALEKSGFKGDVSNRLNPQKYEFMFETHIEQGPILENNGNSVGIVDCVLGMFSCRVRFFGQTVHAGTFPMHKRKDAFYGAALALRYLHEEFDKLGDSDLVYTTGEVICRPCVHNCVPNYFEFSLDVRHKNQQVLNDVLNIIKACSKRTWAGCTCDVELRWKHDTVTFDKELMGFIESACCQLRVNYQYIHSGAGHDAQFVSYMLPTAMVFVQSKNGLSHCESEFSDLEHCVDGANVMLESVLLADKL